MFAHYFPTDRYIRRQNRQSAAHGFHLDEAEAFATGGKEQDGMAGKFFLHISAGSVQNDSVVQTVGGYIFFNPSFQRAFPIDVEIPFLIRFNESVERADGQISSFLVGESPDVNECFAGKGRFSGRVLP